MGARITARVDRPPRGGIREIVVRMAGENPRWGYTRIQGALYHPGHEIGRNTVSISTASVPPVFGLGVPPPRRSSARIHGPFDKDQVTRTPTSLKDIPHPKEKARARFTLAAWPWGEGETASRPNKSLLSTPRPLGPVAVALDHDLVGTVRQPIQRRGSQD